MYLCTWLVASKAIKRITIKRKPKNISYKITDFRLYSLSPHFSWIDHFSSNHYFPLGRHTQKTNKNRNKKTNKALCWIPHWKNDQDSEDLIFKALHCHTSRSLFLLQLVAKSRKAVANTKLEVKLSIFGGLLVRKLRDVKITIIFMPSNNMTIQS